MKKYVLPIILASCFVLAIFAAVVIGVKVAMPAISQQTSIIATTASPETQPKPKPTTVEGVSQSDIQVSLNSVAYVFEGFAVVTFSAEDEAFLIMPTSDGLISLCESGGSEWFELTDSITEVSSIISADTPGYSIYLQNPYDANLILFAAVDGEVIYNYILD